MPRKRKTHHNFPTIKEVIESLAAINGLPDKPIKSVKISDEDATDILTKCLFIHFKKYYGGKVPMSQTTYNQLFEMMAGVIYASNRTGIGPPNSFFIDAVLAQVAESSTNPTSAFRTAFILGYCYRLFFGDQEKGD